MTGRHIVADSTFSNRSDEIGQLAQSLNGLAGDLNHSIFQLEAANRDLEAANVHISSEMERERALDQKRRTFIAGASHELKTPLALISGYPETLLHDINPERRQEHAERIMNSAMHMGRLVKELMLSTKLEDPMYKLRIGRFSLGRMVRTAASDFSQAIADKQLILTEILASDDETAVEADEERIQQVILNLLSNAVRYTPPGGALSLTVEKFNAHVRFIIENKGVTIPEAELAKIWDLFYRPGKACSADSGGSGVGLAVVRTILEQHESNYGVENTENGVRFYFTLQAAQFE
jgi:signal transduction histidine kinase